MPLKLTKRESSTAWHVTGTVAGQRVRETTGTPDRRLAEEYRARREGELFRGALYGPQVVKTWEEACLSYVEVKRPSATDRAYLRRITAALGRTRLAEISQEVVDRTIAVLCPGGAPATKLRSVVTPIRAVLRHASKRGWCGVPNLEVPEGAAGDRRTRWLTPAELIRLLEAAALHLRPLVVFLVCTGARLSEALSLAWEHVDLRHGRATLRDVKAHRHEVRDRIVELPPAAVAALASLPHRDGAVFRTDDGSPYRTFGAEELDFGGQIRTAWATACRKAGFKGAWKGGGKDAQGNPRQRWWQPEDVTPHVLRHTWASWRYAVHRDLLRLKAEGDWSSVALVERYAKLVPEALVPEILAVWGLPPAPTADFRHSTRP